MLKQPSRTQTFDAPQPANFVDLVYSARTICPQLGTLQRHFTEATSNALPNILAANSKKLRRYLAERCAEDCQHVLLGDAVVQDRAVSEDVVSS